PRKEFLPGQRPFGVRGIAGHGAPLRRRSSADHENTAALAAVDLFAVIWSTTVTDCTSGRPAKSAIPPPWLPDAFPLMEPEFIAIFAPLTVIPPPPSKLTARLPATSADDSVVGHLA
ncbi:hypothetical protein AB0H07_35130, partial [Streptomyces sp. NPDC021354]|uniref:hypothetical protein n=1 Tax=Streptomyces sp. NPDC021354 TaxID=3154793 RepID=UPI0033C21FEC